MSTLIERMKALRIRVRKGIYGTPEGTDEAVVKEAIAALRSLEAPGAATVAHDMVLVPREPTEAMRSAFSIAWLNAQRVKPPVKFAAAYTAMLAASPEGEPKP